MCKKGTVILVPFPFTDLSGNKVRPAVIVSDGKIGSDVIVLFVTSQSKLKSKHSVAIKANEKSGIKTNSKVICSKIATLEAKIILGELGQVNKVDQKKIDIELKRVLSL